MISEDQLDEYRVLGTKVRVSRDSDENNDVYGIVVAWDDVNVLIRRENSRVVRLSRTYTYMPADAKKAENSPG